MIQKWESVYTNDILAYPSTEENAPIFKLLVYERYGMCSLHVHTSCRGMGSKRCPMRLEALGFLVTTTA